MLQTKVTIKYSSAFVETENQFKKHILWPCNFTSIFENALGTEVGSSDSSEFVRLVNTLCIVFIITFVGHWFEAKYLAQYALKAEVILIAIALSFGCSLLLLVIEKFVEDSVVLFRIAIALGAKFTLVTIAIIFRSLKHFIGVERFLDNLFLFKAVFGCTQ